MKLKGYFGNLFKNVRLNDVGRTVVIVVTSIVVITVFVYVFFF
jgi:hypothetical protein